MRAPDDFADDDFRKFHPRFQGENFKKNIELVGEVEAMAREKGCTAAQLALAWVLAQGEDIVPIPGTKHVRYLDENIAALEVSLTAEDLISVVLTATPDLTSEFPAYAARLAGLSDVPLLSATEIAVPGAMPRVIRLLAHVETDVPRSSVKHVYLRGAAALRTDLNH